MLRAAFRANPVDHNETGQVPVEALWEIVPELLPLYKDAGLDFTEQDIVGMIVRDR